MAERGLTLGDILHLAAPGCLRRRLQRAAVPHQRFDRVAARRAGELLALALDPVHDGDRQPGLSRDLVAETGLIVEQLTDLADRMKRAKFGVLFFGMGLSTTRGKHMNSAAALTLAAELNAFTRFVAMPMRGHGNVTVRTW